MLHWCESVRLKAEFSGFQQSLLQFKWQFESLPKIRLKIEIGLWQSGFRGLELSLAKQNRTCLIRTCKGQTMPTSFSPPGEGIGLPILLWCLSVCLSVCPSVLSITMVSIFRFDVKMTVRISSFAILRHISGFEYDGKSDLMLN